MVFDIGSNCINRMVYDTINLMFSIRMGVLSATLLLLTLSAAILNAETPLERGKYLVEYAGICGDCHTPLLNGNPDVSKQLKGATLGFQPIGEIPHWHKTAPDISSTSP